MLDVILRDPASAMERWLIAGLAFLVLVAALAKTARAVEVSNSRPLVCGSVAVAGLAVLLSAMWLARDMVLPGLGWPATRAVLIASGVAVSFIRVIPLMAAVQNASPVSAAIGWGAALLAGLLVVLVCTTIAHALQRGAVDIESRKSRTIEIQRFLEESTQK